MSYQPVVPLAGPAGWSFLQRTRETQQEAFEKSPVLQRSTDAFRERIGQITSAAELVEDRQLLQVALGAFGLDGDIDSRALIEKVLSSDTTSRESLTSRFTDKRYEAFSKAFGFGSVFGPRVNDPGFADRIVEAYNDRQFEIAVGDTAPDMRLAMGLSRELAQINDKSLSDDAAWFSVMANKPLRAVFEKAMALPKSIGTLDIDQQLTIFRDRAQSVFGVSEVRDLAAPEIQDKARDLFLIRSQAEAGASSFTSASVALSLLTAPRLF